jgi:hypothetical protein
MRPRRLNVHKYLLSTLVRIATDYEPSGEVPDSERGPDCSCGCDWFLWLEIDPDIGICCNKKSSRYLLLTQEHQAGKRCFEQGKVKLARHTAKEIDYIVRRRTAKAKLPPREEDEGYQTQPTAEMGTE